MAETTTPTITTTTTTPTTTPTGAIDEAVKTKKLEGKTEPQKKIRIHVSNTKKPFFFYFHLAKRYIKQHDEIELCALGMAIPTVVIIAEILKRNGLAIGKKVSTSTVGSKDETKGRSIQKAKIEIVLGRTDKVDKLKKTTVATAPTKTEDKKE